MHVTRQGGKGVSIAFFLLLGCFGLAFLGLFVFVALMQTKTFVRSMLLFGSVAVFGGFFLAAVWGIWGGDPSHILSWELPLAALLITIIGGLLAVGVDITCWRWSDVHPKLRKRYLAANAVLALVAPAAVWLGITAIE